MKVGILQFSPVFGDKVKNMEKIKSMLDRVSADLIVLPELCTTGYLFSSRHELAGLAEGLDGPTMLFMTALARENKMALAYGFAEARHDAFFNSMALVSPKGLIGVYRKVHLFMDEKSLFEPGSEGFGIHKHKRIAYGMLVCFDWIFPEAARALALRGAQVILHAANLVLPYCPDAMITRAIENRVFVVTANRTGSEERKSRKFRFIGTSQIVSPDGKVLARANDNDECVKTVKIDPALALNKNITPVNNIITDRKPELYER